MKATHVVSISAKEAKLGVVAIAVRVERGLRVRLFFGRQCFRLGAWLMGTTLREVEWID